MARILLTTATMFENEMLRLVEMRVQARGNRTLLARIDRALRLLTQARPSDDGAQLVALQHEIDALLEELDRTRSA
jgi:hypothetical protein